MLAKELESGDLYRLATGKADSFTRVCLENRFRWIFEQIFCPARKCECGRIAFCKRVLTRQGDKFAGKTPEWIYQTLPNN